MVYFVGMILFAIAAWFVAAPILRPRISDDENDFNGRQNDPGRSGTVSLLEELEMDRMLGNISEDEYRSVGAEYWERLGLEPGAGESDCG